MKPIHFSFLFCGRPTDHGRLSSLFTIQRGQLCHSSQLWGRTPIEGEEGPGVHHDADIERFYTSTAWRKCRKSVLQDRGGLCELCLSKGLIVPAVHVHHRKPITPENLDDPRITLDASNLMALCEECHAEQHRTKRWRCDELGHVSI